MKLNFTQINCNNYSSQKVRKQPSFKRLSTQLESDISALPSQIFRHQDVQGIIGRLRELPGDITIKGGSVRVDNADRTCDGLRGLAGQNKNQVLASLFGVFDKAVDLLA